MTNYRLTRVLTPAGEAIDEFVMIAPMKTLSQFLRLRREAEDRIKRETLHGDTCRLHTGGYSHKEAFDVELDIVAAPASSVGCWDGRKVS